MKNTKDQLLILFLTLISINFTVGQSDNVKFYTNNKSNTNYLKVDDFYLSHYLYLDLFLRESLFTQANETEVAYVLNIIKENASIDFPLDIEIRLERNKIYKLRVKFIEKDGEILFIVFTNFNLKTKKFEKEITGDSYTRWYFLNGTKMTYRKDMSRENDYSAMNDIDLANAYLFDELTENDKEVELTVEKGKKNEEDLYQIFIGDLILLKNFIYTDDEKRTEELFEQITSDLISNKSEKELKGIQSVLDVTKFQIEVMNLIE